jgi:hypothetical protein
MIYMKTPLLLCNDSANDMVSWSCCGTWANLAGFVTRLSGTNCILADTVPLRWSLEILQARQHHGEDFK